MHSAMTKRTTQWLLALTGVWICVAWISSSRPEAAGAAQSASAQSAQPAAEYKAVIDKYCVSCHSDRIKAGGLLLDKLDINNLSANAEQWEKVVRKMRVGMMPPLGQPRPEQAVYDSMSTFLENALDRGAKDPGRPRGMHRLNRAEYANAVRDLLALDVDVNALLPADDASFGFDNIAEVLGVSPALQERYLNAANKIAALAVGDMAQLRETEERTFSVPGDTTQTQHEEGLPLGTRGGRLFPKVWFPLDATYQFKIKLARTNTSGIRGLESAHKIIVVIDGRQVFENVVGGKDDMEALKETEGDIGTNNEMEDRLQFKVPVKAGPHDIGVTFVQKSQAERPTILQPFRAQVDNIDAEGLSKIGFMKVAGPIEATSPGDTPSRRRIFTCRPTTEKEEAACARTILSGLARRAYRRPVTDRDVQALMGFYENGRSEGNFENAIGLALSYMLANPAFIFRLERDPAGVPAGSAYRLSDLEIAARLSFFLWSSIPDNQLLDVAARGQLKNPVVLQQQVKRMLADPKAIALTKNFAGQWLWIRNLNSVSPNYLSFPEFDRNIREGMRTETEMFFKSMIDEDRPVTELLTANYTFVNERLAKHYGIPGVYGSQFRRVTLTDPNRFGLLGQGSFLTVTSNPDRTSPVHRGKWVLENLLGTPPPPPPPNVPPLKQEPGAAKPKTLRDEMEAHRASPVCASCHKLMDPIGFALENFDGIGQWRDAYPGGPSSPGTKIDASGQLADGSAINGPVSVRQAILRRPEAFVQTMTEKLMIYSLGRGLEYYDMPAVRGIVRDAAKTNYRFSSIVMGIVTSAPFQMRTKTQAETASAH